MMRSHNASLKARSRRDPLCGARSASALPDRNPDFVSQIFYVYRPQSFGVAEFRYAEKSDRWIINQSRFNTYGVS